MTSTSKTILLPSPEWVERVSLALKTSVRRICRQLGQPHGAELLMLELRATGHDAFASWNYFSRPEKRAQL